MMKRISKQEFLEILNNRKPGERLEFKDYEFDSMDLSGMDLSNIDFVLSSLQHVGFPGPGITAMSILRTQVLKIRCLMVLICMEQIFEMPI